MDSIICELRRLVKSVVLVQPEQAIFRTLSPLSIPLLNSSSTNELTELEGLLHQLLGVNQGIISTQCIILIGRKLKEIYKRNIMFSADHFVKDLISKPTQAKIILFGVLSGTQGLMPNHYQDIIPKMFKVDEKLYIASLYCIRHAFKTLKGTSGKLDSHAISFVKKVLNKATEQVQVAAIKLLRILVIYRNNDFANISPILDDLILNCSSELVHDEIYKSIAKYAAIYLTSTTANFEKITQIFSRYTKVAIFKYFATIVGPSVISKHSNQLSQLYINKFPHALSTIVSSCSDADRKNIFDALQANKDIPGALQTIALFPQTPEIIYKSANIALTYFRSKNPYVKEISSQYFSTFAREQRNVAFKFVYDWLNKLARGDMQDEEIIPACAVVSRIIAGSPDRDQMLQNNAQALLHIANTGLNQRSIFASLFVGVWYILSIIPESEVSSELVQKGIDRVVENVISSAESDFENLFDGLLQYYMLQPNGYKAKEVVNYAMNSNVYLASSAITALCVLVPRHFNGDKEMVKIIRNMVDIVLNIPPSVDIVKSMSKMVVPFEEDIVAKRHFLPKHQYENTKIANKLMTSIPSLITSLPEGAQKSLVEEINKKQQNAMHRLLLKHIVINEKTREHIPRGFLIPLLKSLKGTDRIFLISTCEVIAQYIQHNDSYFKATVNFIEQNKTNPSNYLIAALVSHTHISNDYLIRLAMCINERASNPTLRLTSFYAMKCIVASHPMDVASLCLGAHQLSLFMTSLNDFSLPEPLLIHSVAETFNALLPTLVPEALEPNSPLRPQIVSVVQTICMTPYLTAREDFYETLNSVLTYAFPLISEIDFDSSRSINSASMSLRLYVLSAFSHLAAQGTLPSTVISLSKDAAQMMQQTGMKLDFISAVSNAVDVTKQNNELYALCTLVQSTLQHNTIPGIEGVTPSENLSLECLNSSVSIFNKLMTIKPFPSIVINDIISAVCISTLRNNFMIKKAAFDALAKIIVAMRRVKKLYENYEKHLLTAAKIGFASGFDVSAKYLTAFVNDSEECLDLYSREILKMQGMQQNAYPIIARFFKHAMNREDSKEKYKDVVKNVAPLFADLIKQAMSINFMQPDPQSLSEFRACFSEFYEDLAAVFSWMTTIEKVIDPTVVLSFYVVELRVASDIWQANGAIAGINAFIKYYPETRSDIVEEGLEAVLSILPQIGVSVGQNCADLVESLISIENHNYNDRVIEIITAIAAHTPCNANVYVWLYDNIKDKFADVAAELFVASMMSSRITDEQISSLIVLYLERGPHDEISSESLKFCRQNQRVKLGLSLCEILLTLNDVSFLAIGEFLAAHVRHGAIDILLKIKDSEILAKILSVNVANTIFGFCLGDNTNAKNFATVLLKAVESSDNVEFKKCVITLCANCMSTWINDVECAKLYASLFKRTKASLGDKFEEVWKQLSSQDREFCIRGLEIIGK